jgi:hypothetical protein
MAKQTVKITGEATPVQIAQWKQQFGDVFAIELQLSDSEKAVGYFRKPDLAVLSMVQRYKDDQIKAGEVMFENLWLGGADCIKQDDMLKLSAMQQFPVLFEFKHSEIKKL